MPSDTMNQLCEIAHSLESDILSGPELPSETNYHLHEALDKLQAVIAGTPAPMSYRGGVVRDVAKKIDALEARGLEHSALDDAIAEFDAQVSERIATAEATELQAQISELIARRDDQDDDDAAVNGGIKSGHWAAQKPATLGLGVTRGTRRRPVSRASQIAGG